MTAKQYAEMHGFPKSVGEKQLYDFAEEYALIKIGALYKMIKKKNPKLLEEILKELKSQK